MPTRRGGRPALLSRSEIVKAALRLLGEDGSDAITMKRVAEAVGASPMGLYRHVKNRDELLEVMLESLLDALDLELPEDAGWRENIRSWMRGVRQHFVAYPEIFGLMDLEAGQQISPAWLRTVGELVAPLEAAGLNGPEKVSALLWVSRLTMGMLIQEVTSPISDTTGVLAGLGRLGGEDALPWVELLPELKRMDDDAHFRFVEEQALAAIERLRASPSE